MADDSVVVDINGDTGGFDKAVGGMQGTISAASVAMGTMLADLGKKALASFGQMIASGDQFNSAINQISASTGATGAELDSLRAVVKDVYGNNFGDNYDDVANSVAEISKQTGLVGDALQSATEGAISLGDTFGYDVAESTKAAASLMENFGITAEEAYNTIAVGAQNGADQNGNLIDTLNEYAPQYAALGLSAEQFTQSLIAGAQQGAFDVDKVGDAVKEFNIRCKDGSKTTAEGFAAIGMSADAMASKFATGGDVAEQAFMDTVDALGSMADPVERNQAAIALFGTQFEDLQSNMIPMLQSMADTSGVAYDALGQINEVKYDDVGSAIEGLKRTIGAATIDIRSNLSGGIADAIGGLVNGINAADGDAGKIFDAVVQAGKDALTTFAPILESFWQNGKEIISKLVQGIKDNMPQIQAGAGEILQVLIDGFINNIGNIIAIGIPLIQSLIQGLIDNLPMIIEAAVQLITALITSLVDNAPMLIQAAVQLIISLSNMIVENLPMIIDAAIQLIMALVNGLVENLPILIPAVIQLVTAVQTGLLEQLPMLIDAAIQMITAIMQGLLDNLDILIPAAIQMMISLALALIDNIPKIVAKIPQIIRAIFNAFKDVDWLELGGDILRGIGNGLLDGVKGILGTVKDVAGSIWDGFTDFFGIASPSKLMRDTVGKYLLPGVAVGVDATASDTASSINGSLDNVVARMDTSKLQAELDNAVQSQGYYGTPQAPSDIKYNSTADDSASAYKRTQQQSGDIIIPVSIGGENLETVVVKAARIANARSGGNTL